MVSIKALIKRIIIFLIPKFIIAELESRLKSRNGHFLDQNIYYSQAGEDIILERFFGDKQKGFYLDIGAHHPTRFSNTYKFYLKGWNGINIDATPGSMVPFQNVRPQDVNVELGVAGEEGKLNYFIFDEPALNTFSKERSEYLLANTSYKLKGNVVVKTKTLKQVMAEYLPANQHIDFMTIDVEGLDLDILLSNDWDKYRPYVVVAEDIDGSLENIAGSRLYTYFKSLGYELFSRTYNTVFFRDLLHN